MKTCSWIVAIILAIPALTPLYAAETAEEAKEPEKHFTGNIGAGLALTSGNTKTSNFNITGTLTYDPKTKNIMKFNGLFLKSSADDVDTAENLTLGFRDEYSISKRVFFYGAMGYLRDPFKDIIYLLNPQGGIGFKPVMTERIELTFNAGGGAVWEKDRDVDVHTSGTINTGENITINLSDNATVTQGFSAFWKTENFSDALYHFNIALAASVTSKTEVKVEFMDNYKNVTPNPTIKKNDTAFIVSFLYKI